MEFEVWMQQQPNFSIDSIHSMGFDTTDCAFTWLAGVLCTIAYD